MGLAGWRLRRGRLNHDDDLARGAALLDQPHGGCRIGEQVGPVDHRSDVPGFDEVADLGAGSGPGLWTAAGPRLWPAGSGLLDQNGAGVEQIEAPALHVLLGLGSRLGGDQGDVAAGGRGVGKAG